MMIIPRHLQHTFSNTFSWRQQQKGKLDFFKAKNLMCFPYDSVFISRWSGFVATNITRQTRADGEGVQVQPGTQKIIFFGQLL